MAYIDVDAIISKAGKHLQRLLFPPKCMFCGKILDNEEEEKHQGLCFECDKANPKVGWLSGTTRLGPALVAVDGVFSGCEYTDTVKSAVVRLKFYDNTQLARPLGYLISRGLEKYTDLFEYIVPVPLSEKRMRERGFNQSQLIAEYLGQILNREVCTETLARVRHTQKQSLTSGIQRQENINGAFEVKNNRLMGKSVLLIDDVLTTGSTVAECANVLRRNQVSRIYIAVVAVAL